MKRLQRRSMSLLLEMPSMSHNESDEAERRVEQTSVRTHSVYCSCTRNNFKEFITHLTAHG